MTTEDVKATLNSKEIEKKVEGTSSCIKGLIATRGDLRRRILKRNITELSLRTMVKKTIVRNLL